MKVFIVQALLAIFSLCVGAVLNEIDAKKRRRGWKEYRPSTNPLRDFK